MKLFNRIALGATLLACGAGLSAAQTQVGSRQTGVHAAGARDKDINVVPYLLGSGTGGTQTDAVNASTYLWDNGDDDRQVGILSTVNDHVDAQAADDCWLKEGMWYDVQDIYVRMAVTDGFEPDTVLYVYEDCDGRPDDTLMPVAYPQEEWYLVDSTPGGDFAGTRIWEIRYHIDQFAQGPQLGWLSPVHRGEGLAFWVSANHGKVQGREAQLRSPNFGLPDWTDASDELCCGICTDYYIKVEGKCCWRVLNQSTYDLDGLTDPIYAQNHPWTRTLDDFQLADPCKELDEFGICRIVAYFATNCDVETIRGEIFSNVCDMPENASWPEVTLSPDRVEPTGETVEGLPVYEVSFLCPPVNLGAGCNYWFSIFSEQGAFLGKRSVWLYRHRDVCNIRLNAGKFYYPAIGIDPATPVSELPLGPGVDREFAYSVWVCRPRDTMGSTGQ